MPDVFTVIEGVVAPVLHVFPDDDDDVSVVVCPSHNTVPALPINGVEGIGNS